MQRMAGGRSGRGCEQHGGRREQRVPSAGLDARRWPQVGAHTECRWRPTRCLRTPPGLCAPAPTPSSPGGSRFAAGDVDLPLRRYRLGTGAASFIRRPRKPRSSLFPGPRPECAEVCKGPALCFRAEFTLGGSGCARGASRNCSLAQSPPSPALQPLARLPASPRRRSFTNDWYLSSGPASGRP